MVSPNVVGNHGDGAICYSHIETFPNKTFQAIQFNQNESVFFSIRKQNRKQSGPRKTVVFCVSFEKKVLIKSSVHKEMVHRHNKIVGKKSSVSLPPLPPPPRPLPSKIKESQNYVKQLEYELQRLESMQPNALDAVRFHRFVS